MSKKSLVRYKKEEEDPLIVKHEDEHIDTTKERVDKWEVEATVTDEDDGWWKEEVVYAPSEERALELFNICSTEEGLDVVGNEQVSLVDE